MRDRRERTGCGERRGYTLIELVVVVGILSVMTLAALPFFSAMLRSSQLDAAARQLAGDVREARALATQTGWQYRLVGFNAGGGQPQKNQYHLLGRSSPAGAWPAATSEPFQSATQMAGAWINFNQLYPGVTLNAAVAAPSFYVSFNAQGVAVDWNPTADPWMTITPTSGASPARQVRITAAGGVKIQ
jgi:prepilin-type N-terminal cleavage/methylation domain-containing protein